MTSSRHKSVVVDDGRAEGDEPFLDAARAAVLAVGVRRTTLTDIARRAGVSRMTIYRRWPDMQALVGDLLVREWNPVVAALTGDEKASPDPAGLARRVVAAVTELRRSPVLRRVIDVDPELLLPYLLVRRGRNQERLLATLQAQLAAGQRAGTMREGDSVRLARGLLLAVHGFALSAGTMTDAATSAADLDEELVLMVERYVAR